MRVADSRSFLFGSVQRILKRADLTTQGTDLLVEKLYLALRLPRQLAFLVENLRQFAGTGLGGFRSARSRIE